MPTRVLVLQVVLIPCSALRVELSVLCLALAPLLGNTAHVLCSRQHDLCRGECGVLRKHFSVFLTLRSGLQQGRYNGQLQNTCCNTLLDKRAEPMICADDNCNDGCSQHTKVSVHGSEKWRGQHITNPLIATT